MIDAKTAKDLSDKAEYGVTEILNAIDANVKQRAKNGYKDADLTFSNELVSPEELAKALEIVESLSYAVKRQSSVSGFYKVTLSW